MKRPILLFCAALLAGCSSQPAPHSESAQAPASITFTSKSPEAIAHFEKGATLADNVRPAEAAEEFAAALKLDPGFLVAQAEHGMVTPGPDGLKEIESAAAAAKDVSEPERLLIEAILAGRRGEGSTQVSTLRRLTEVAPRYSRGHYLLGARLLAREDVEGGVVALEKATGLDPNNGGAQNMLGYAALRRGDAEGAISAFNEYVRISPQEPNAQDSLGEALLAAGRFKEAEAAFQKALDLSPQFAAAYEGIAYAKFYAGDWAGGRDALMKAKAAAVRPVDKFQMDVAMSAAAVAQKKTAEALQHLDTAAKTEGADPVGVATIPYLRAAVFVMSNRAREALSPTAEVIKAADSGQFPAGISRNLRRQALRARVAAEAQLKDAAAAKKTSALLDMDAESLPDSVTAQSAMHFGRGLLAVASADTAGARGHFDQCTRSDAWCRMEGVLAAERAGDKAGAAAARDALLELYERDTLHLIVRSRLAADE
jgi:tetratricopeptide (TPR) repeat protein